MVDYSTYINMYNKFKSDDQCALLINQASIIFIAHHHSSYGMMVTVITRILLLLIVVALQQCDVLLCNAGSLDPTKGTGSSNVDFMYRQSYHLELPTTKSISDRNNHQNSTKTTTTTVPWLTKQIHSSSGNYNSNIGQRIHLLTFDHHGSSNFMASFNSKQNDNTNEDENESDSDDDDDDDDENNDDDDGHSSMLSLVSLHRSYNNKQLQSRLYSYYHDSSSSTSSRPYRSSGSKSRFTSPIQRNKIRTFDDVIRNVRGGAMDSPIRSETTTTTTSWIAHICTMAYHSQVGRNLIVSAIVTLIFEGMMGHILEFLKIVMQTSSSNDSITYIQVIRTITAEKGIFGLWDGFCPWGIVQAVCKGAVFGLAHATALQVLKPLAEQQYIPMALALTLAGGIGGGFQGYILSPTLLLKTRVMTNPVFREKMSALRTTLLSFTIGYDVVKKEGVGALMKGANVFATKRVFDWASRYYFADLFEDIFTQIKKGTKLTVAEKSTASLLGGVFSTLVTLPLDVLVAKTQDAKKAGIPVSPMKLFQDELREKGWIGIRNAYMRGFEARLLHVCLTTVVIKTGTPIAYEAIFGSQ